VKSLTEAGLGLIKEMIRLACEAEHDAVWTFDDGRIIYISWDKETSERAVKALNDSNCLCDTELGHYPSHVFLESDCNYCKNGKILGNEKKCPQCSRKGNPLCIYRGVFLDCHATNCPVHSGET